MDTEQRSPKIQASSDAARENPEGVVKAPERNDAPPATEVDEVTSPSMGELGADSGEIKIEPPDGQPETPREVEGTTEHPGGK